MNQTARGQIKLKWQLFHFVEWQNVLYYFILVCCREIEKGESSLIGPLPVIPWFILGEVCEYGRCSDRKQRHQNHIEPVTDH